MLFWLYSRLIRSYRTRVRAYHRCFLWWIGWPARTTHTFSIAAADPQWCQRSSRWVRPMGCQIQASADSQRSCSACEDRHTWSRTSTRRRHHSRWLTRQLIDRRPANAVGPLTYQRPAIIHCSRQYRWGTTSTDSFKRQLKTYLFDAVWQIILLVFLFCNFISRCIVSDVFYCAGGHLLVIGAL